MSIKINNPHNQVSELELKRRRMCRIASFRSGSTITCQKGTLWVTQSGDMQDYILSAGQRFVSKRRGAVLVEALRDSQVEIAGSAGLQIQQINPVLQGC